MDIRNMMDLEGLFFHTQEDGKIQYQGRILKVSPHGFLEVQLYSFVDGEPTNIETWKLTDNTFAAFYRTDVDMNISYYGRSLVERTIDARP